MAQLLFILAVVAGISAWWQLMQGRQTARRAAGSVCSNHDLQLLDDTVSLSSVTWERSGKRSHVRIKYRFEFATDGANRKSGEVQIIPPGNLTVTLELEDGQLIESMSAL